MSLPQSLLLALVLCTVLHILVMPSVRQVLLRPRNSVDEASRSKATIPPLSRERPRARFSTLSVRSPTRVASIVDMNSDKPHMFLLRNLAKNAATTGIRSESAPKLVGSSSMIVDGTASIAVANGTATTRCVGWKQTGQCRSDGPRESFLDRGCSAEVDPIGRSGYCDCTRIRAAKLSCPSIVDSNNNNNGGGGGAFVDDDGDVAAALQPFSCQDVCDKEALSSHIASVVARSALSERERRLLAARAERKNQRDRILSSELSSSSACIGGFVPSVVVSDVGADRCGSIDAALERWKAQAQPKSNDGDGNNNNNKMQLSCSALIPRFTSGVCFCKDGVMAAVTCSSSQRQKQQEASAMSQLTCEKACALGPAATSVSQQQAGFGGGRMRGYSRSQNNNNNVNDGLRVELFLSPLAGAQRQIGLTRSSSSSTAEQDEIGRRTARLTLIESHREIETELVENSNDDDPDFVPPELQQLVDVERQASVRARMLRAVRRDGSTIGGSQIAGAGHAGSKVDVQFEQDLNRIAAEATVAGGGAM